MGCAKCRGVEGSKYHGRNCDKNARFDRSYRITDSGCWEWVGPRQPNGYGVIAEGLSTHRFSYERFKGAIPLGMCVLHSCDNKICVNPEHLFLGTNNDNTQDMMAKGRNHWLNMTHCRRGHEFTPENTRINKEGHRKCRTCVRAAQRQYWPKSALRRRQRLALRSISSPQQTLTENR